MKSIAKFKIGSSYFFNKFDDYIQKDVDELHIMDSFVNRTNVLNFKGGNSDIFFYRNMEKEEFINDILDSKVIMRIGKFLIPEFCKYIGFTIDDLKSIRYLFDEIDDKHKYEQLICDYYLENNDFSLTEEQLGRVYEFYKKEREDLYKQN
jgi:hypothetical protein